MRGFLNQLALLVIVAAGVLSLPAEVRAGALRPRGLAGYIFRDLRPGEADSLRLPDPHGVVVAQVFAGTAAAEAGLRPGDVVRAYDLGLVGNGSDLPSLARRYRAGDTVRVAVAREGAPLVLPLVLRPAPPPVAAPGTELELAEFAAPDGVRLRAAVLGPAGRSGARLPGLLMVSALGSPSLDALPRFDPGRDIAAALARAGFRVLRFELRGAGDSEGADYRDSGFEAEVADNRAALDYLRQRADIDPERVFVWGHSTGGVVAALLAASGEAAGACVSATFGRTFYERLVATVRRQGEVAGDAPAAVDAAVRDHVAFLAAVEAGEEPAAIAARRPELARFLNAAGRIHDDRTAAYWRELLALNLGEVWGRVEVPLLVVYPEADFLTVREDHERIAAVARAAGNRDVRFETMAGMDHAFARAASFAESHARYGAPDRALHPGFAELLVRWLEDRAENR